MALLTINWSNLITMIIGIALWEIFFRGPIVNYLYKEKKHD